jgi:hypothetical protein
MKGDVDGEDEKDVKETSARSGEEVVRRRWDSSSSQTRHRPPLPTLIIVRSPVKCLRRT